MGGKSRSNTILLFLWLFLSALVVPGCETAIKTESFDIAETNNVPEKASDRRIKIYLPFDDLPDNVIPIGHIAIGDTGFTTDCGRMTVIRQAEEKAKEMGGDAIHIYDLNPPDYYSTCYRISANVLISERLETSGTAFFIDSNGTMITANHVISGAERILVQCLGQPKAEAWVLKQSKNNDVAVITTKRSSEYFLPMGTNRDVIVGSDVFTVGYPVVGMLGKEPKYTEGNISASSGLGDEQSLMQISVPVQPGNSGGPIVTEDGLVVGVVVSTAAIKAFYSVANALPQNINWATKIDYAKLLLDAPPNSNQKIPDVIEHAQNATCLVTTE